MIDRFLNWGDYGKPKSGKVKGRCQPIESASSRYYKRQLVIKNNSGDWSQSENAKYFEWIIVLIITNISPLFIGSKPLALTNCGRWEELFHWFKDILAWKRGLSMVYLIWNQAAYAIYHWSTSFPDCSCLFYYKKWLSRQCEDEIAEFLRIKMEQNKQNILLDEFSLLSGC